MTTTIVGIASSCLKLPTHSGVHLNVIDCHISALLQFQKRPFQPFLRVQVKYTDLVVQPAPPPPRAASFSPAETLSPRSTSPPVPHTLPPAPSTALLLSLCRNLSPAFLASVPGDLERRFQVSEPLDGSSVGSFPQSENPVRYTESEGAMS